MRPRFVELALSYIFFSFYFRIDDLVTRQTKNITVVCRCSDRFPDCVTRSDRNWSTRKALENS